MPARDFIITEKNRNWENRETYTRLMRLGLGCKRGKVVVSHHLVFQVDPGLPANEIPAADTLIFDHEIMGKVFGAGAISIMSHLASLPLETRDSQLKRYLDGLETPI